MVEKKLESEILFLFFYYCRIQLQVKLLRGGDKKPISLLLVTFCAGEHWRIEPVTQGSRPPRQDNAGKVGAFEGAFNGVLVKQKKVTPVHATKTCNVSCRAADKLNASFQTCISALWFLVEPSGLSIERQMQKTEKHSQ